MTTRGSCIATASSPDVWGAHTFLIIVGCEHKRIAELIEVRSDFLRCRPPAKGSPENRAVPRLAGICGGISAFSLENPNLWPGIEISAGTIDLQAAKEIPLMRWKFVSESWIFSAASAKESLEILNLDRIFAAVGRRSKAQLKIALFCGFLEVVGGISALSPEIRFVSRNNKRIGGNPAMSRDFSARAGSFTSTAGTFQFSAGDPKMRLKF